MYKLIEDNWYTTDDGELVMYKAYDTDDTCMEFRIKYYHNSKSIYPYTCRAILYDRFIYEDYAHDEDDIVEWLKDIEDSVNTNLENYLYREITEEELKADIDDHLNYGLFSEFLD